MHRKHVYSEAIKIAAELRKHVPRQRAVLFHGTPYPCAILKSDFLICPRNLAEGGIAFTRQLHVAVYWALLGRMVDERQGAVFVLDRDKLARKFSLTPFCWRKSGADKSRGDFEAEDVEMAVLKIGNGQVRFAGHGGGGQREHKSGERTPSDDSLEPSGRNDCGHEHGRES